MKRKAIAALVASLLLAPVAWAKTGADPVVREWPQWPYRASCGVGAFDPNSTFATPARAERGQRRSARVLRRFLKDGLIPWLPRNNWRLAVDKPRELQFIHGHPGAEVESGKELQWLRLRRKRGRWRMPDSSGPCYLSSVLASVAQGRWATSWFLADDQPQLTPETRQIKVYVGAPCSIEEEGPAALAKPPQFTEISGKLVMAIWLRSGRFHERTVCDEGLVPGPAMSVELPEPLGDRELVDGGVFPPNPARYLDSRSAFLHQ
jgi:hypothetical protein